MTMRFEFEGHLEDYDLDQPHPDEGCSWTVFFTDCAGSRWRIEEAGFLERITDDALLVESVPGSGIQTR
ncbi:hypothetical protein [Actinoplanes sp. M2I2]|uniref:hypothetical protein n=1 Tax=Actinoplanes sp. M2I2 TaxID=1734444 RepID=UPI00202172C3|nr:hypothetical protein [Actinoplanes sp. M2I2]